MRPRIRLVGVLTFAVSLALGAGAARSWSHGDEEKDEPPAALGISAEEAEIDELARQPARVLAQQALAMLEVTGDDAEAGERVEAALASEEPADVDPAALAEAAEALERGEHEEAIPLLDAALSRPLGSDRGKALHESGREFEPASGTQESIAIVAGAILLVVGALTLLPWRRIRPRLPQRPT